MHGNEFGILKGHMECACMCDLFVLCSCSLDFPVRNWPHGLYILPCSGQVLDLVDCMVVGGVPCVCMGRLQCLQSQHNLHGDRACVLDCIFFF